MKYWTTTDFVNSGRLHARQRRDMAKLLNQGTPLPFATMAELHQVSAVIPACTSMVLIHSEGCPYRRAYLEHPTQENWLALERGGFIATKDIFGYINDALH